jgi:hypothetical protein
MSKTLNARIDTITNTRQDGSKFIKSNNAEYILCNCIVTEGPLKGQRVLAQRTTINGEGVAKSDVVVGQEVVLYPSVTSTGTVFLEVSTATPTVSNDVLAAYFNEVEEKVTA